MISLTFGEYPPDICGSQLRIYAYWSASLPEWSPFGHRRLSVHSYVETFADRPGEVTLVSGDGRATLFRLEPDSPWLNQGDGVFVSPDGAPPLTRHRAGFTQDWPGGTGMVYGEYEPPPRYVYRESEPP